MKRKKGYLYVANKKKFLVESERSARSIKENSSLPIAIVITPQLKAEVNQFFFDIIIEDKSLAEYTYLSKIIGMRVSPFDETLFLDSDTFVCENIDDLFDLLEIVDFSTTIEEKLHTKKWSGLKFENILPEFNTGVILYKKKPIIDKLFNDWLNICIDKNIIIDMPGFREAVLKNFENLKFTILPQEYNLHGFSSMLIINNKAKVIHERLGRKWNTTTPHYPSFDNMKRFSAKINKYSYKRLYIPNIGIIPYNYNPVNILLKVKKMMGISRKSKSNYYFTE